MESKLYNQEGKEVGTVVLPESIFGVPPNNDLLHQVVVSMQANARHSKANVKDRSEVRGGGKKPWKQKGTGRARHGSRRSPLWSGGGITFGPTNEKDYSKKINKKMRVKALTVALSEKFRNEELIFLNAMSLGEAKTKFAKEILSHLSTIPGADGVNTKKRNALFITLTESNNAIKKAFSNFGNVEVARVENMNPVDVLQYKYVVIVQPEKAVPILEKRAQNKRKTQNENRKTTMQNSK